MNATRSPRSDADHGSGERGTAAVGLWMLGTLLTRHPFMMTASRGIVIAKVGEAGLTAWKAHWDREPTFRRHMRLVTTFWGAMLLLDAALRILLVYTMPVGSFPLVSTVLWLVLFCGLLGFNNWYFTRHGLKLYQSRRRPSKARWCSSTPHPAWAGSRHPSTGRSRGPPSH